MFPTDPHDTRATLGVGPCSAFSGSPEAPLLEARVPAGFTSPAEGRVDRRLNLERHLATHPEATFYMRVSGNSMRDAGIADGDLIVVDRSVRPAMGDVVVAALDGEFTVKRLARDARGAPVLRAANPAYRDIPVGEEGELSVWGVVKWAIHKV